MPRRITEKAERLVWLVRNGRLPQAVGYVTQLLSGRSLYTDHLATYFATEFLPVTVEGNVMYLSPGDTVVVDMGVYVEGYTSDIQRAWYVRRDGEDAAPPEIEHRFRTGHDAMMKAIDAMKPGVAGWELDAIAREHLEANGIPAYTHALGHQIGRAVHDGGTTLAPLNARYGERGKPAIRAGEVYTVEPVVHGRTGVDGPPVGHEQDVLVTEDGHENLTKYPFDPRLMGH